ncbi:hypothetical protein EIP86_004030 [Pleurotus ostreatoroseus]|nr:hypothetical protein EIP86_004030 [Pleurotus ostreatoroseus]
METALSREQEPLEVRIRRKVRSEWDSNERIRFHDGLCGSTFDKWIITSPNCTHVPHPAIGIINVAMGPDGYYGEADPIHYPQFLQDATRYPWLPAIRRAPTSPVDRDQLLWQMLTRNLVTPATSTGEELLITTAEHIQHLGRIFTDIKCTVEAFERHHGQHRELCWLSTCAQDALDRLDFPATFRDLIKQHAVFQRYCLYTQAWLQWNVAVMKYFPLAPLAPIPTAEMMGCFTSNPSIVQRLFTHGIPVWFLRTEEQVGADQVIAQWSPIQQPVDHIQLSDDQCLSEHRRDVVVSHTINLVAGDPHLDWIHSQATVYEDIEGPALSGPAALNFHEQHISSSSSHPRINIPSAYRGGYRARSSNRYHPYTPKKLTLNPSEISKFEPYRHSLLAPAIATWEVALAAVDVGKAPPTTTWKYLVPEARLLVSPESPDRQRRHICNWLRVRVQWLYSITHPTYDVGPLTSSQWREYLNTSPFTQDKLASSGKAVERNRQVDGIFRRVFRGKVPGSDIPAIWNEVNVEFITGPLWSTVCREVTWEVAEIAFRLELMRLDRYLVPNTGDPIADRMRINQINAVFPASRGILMKRLPTRADGLATIHRGDWAPYVESLRILISSWPKCPLTIKNASPFTGSLPYNLYDEQERRLFTFYCQTFYSIAGRAASIPRHLFPPSDSSRAAAM